MSERASPTVEMLFQQVLDLDPTARVRFLSQQIPTDDGLRRRVLGLIEAYELAGGEFDARAPLLPPEHEIQPVRVGRYPVENQLAEGGMSIVYLARQEQPARPIALKVIRPSLASENMLARFELEASVLARLRHPGIAHVYDTGRAAAHFADGHTEPRAFMAMELIEGEPVTTFARERGLSLKARVALVAEICDALQAAHQLGVIHRDLKPANILVDKNERPRILDFGAAAFVAELWHDSAERPAAGMTGTGPYLSPEHAGADSGELDTRSDVYSMGVILYELIAGRTPINVDGLPVFEAARAIRDTDAPPLVSVAPNTPGDLSLIVGKALARSKQDRYDSAADFAADLRRFLTFQPVLAHEPSAMYVLRMLVKRRTGLVLAGATAAAALVLVAAIAVQQAVAASREAAAKTIALSVAADARDEAEGAADFLVRMLSSWDPGELGRDVRVRELLDRVAPDLSDDFKGRPSSEARAREAIARTYVGLGEYEQALHQFTQAHAIRVSTSGPEHVATAKCELGLATTLLALDRAEEAEPLYLHATTILERELGASDPDVVRGYAGLGDVYMKLQRFPLAIEQFERAVSRGQARPEGPGIMDLHARANYAFALISLSRLREASVIYEETIPLLRDRLGPDHPSTLNAESGAAVAAQSLGRVDEAEALLRAVLASSERVRGPEHADTVGAANNLARLLAHTRRYDEARAVYTRVIDGAQRSLGPFHRNTLKVRFSLAQTEFLAGNFALSRDQLVTVLADQRRHLGEEHVDVADTLQVLAAAFANLGDDSAGEAAFTESIAMFAKLISPTDPIIYSLRTERAGCLMRLKRTQEALDELLSVTAALTLLDARYLPREIRALEQLAACYSSLGREPEASDVRTRLESLRDGLETSAPPS